MDLNVGDDVGVLLSQDQPTNQAPHIKCVTPEPAVAKQAQKRLAKTAEIDELV